MRNNELVAVPGTRADGTSARLSERDGVPIALIVEPLMYFIPEHVKDPSRRAASEELWVEVTLPRLGAPRPIRLGVKKGGVLEALDVR